MKQAANDDLDSVQVVNFYFFMHIILLIIQTFCLCDQCWGLIIGYYCMYYYVAT